MHLQRVYCLPCIILTELIHLIVVHVTIVTKPVASIIYTVIIISSEKVRIKLHDTW